MTPIRILTGQRFGRLTVIGGYERNSRGRVVWRCRCDCGGTKVTRPHSLLHGITASCGCLHKERCSQAATIHGHTSHAQWSGTYISWAQMIQRCTYPKHNRFHRYGGRGISVCQRWRKFENFLADMGERPPGLSIDRRNNDGNYEPSNCKWSTRKEQAANRCTTRKGARCEERHGA